MHHASINHSIQQNLPANGYWVYKCVKLPGVWINIVCVNFYTVRGHIWNRSDVAFIQFYTLTCDV